MSEEGLNIFIRKSGPSLRYDDILGTKQGAKEMSLNTAIGSADNRNVNSTQNRY